MHAEQPMVLVTAGALPEGHEVLNFLGTEGTEHALLAF